MKLAIAGAALGTLLLLPPAYAQTTVDQSRQPALSSSEQRFMKKAAGGGIGEVKLGQLAVQKASNPEVKQFAQHMIDDHSKANETLKAEMSRHGVTVPSTIDPAAQKSYDKLAKLSGAKFDKAYVEDMLKDHREDVKLFQDEAKNGRDPGLQQFAQETLPTLQEHLQMVERLSKNHVAQR
jgi:putative membrane protein